MDGLPKRYLFDMSKMNLIYSLLYFQFFFIYFIYLLNLFKVDYKTTAKTNLNLLLLPLPLYNDKSNITNNAHILIKVIAC